VKLLRVENDRFFFQLIPREKDLLEIVLRLYPVIPPTHQVLSKSSTADKANQHLLDEALAEQRSENKKRVEDLLTNPGRFRKSGDAIEMILMASEIEWVLQVLNDVHVGNWVLIGSPEQRPRFSPISKHARFIVAMDLACMFESQLLEAISLSS